MKGGENVPDFERIYIENRDFIYKYLRKLTHNDSLSEELTQETFYRAYMNISSLREPEKAPSWLCTIARNTCYSYYSREKRSVPIDEEESITASDNTEDTVITGILSKKALVHLHELEEPYKEVFMLAVFAGLSLSDISKMFGKSESWARVTFYRAKQKLSERMR